MPRCYGPIATWYMSHYLDHKDMKRPTFKDEDYHELQEKYIDWQEDEIKELKDCNKDLFDSADKMLDNENRLKQQIKEMKESKKLLADAYDLREMYERIFPGLDFRGDV